jgi:hypothetical protein
VTLAPGLPVAEHGTVRTAAAELAEFLGRRLELTISGRSKEDG